MSDTTASNPPTEGKQQPPPGQAPPIDPEQVVQPISEGDGELDPEEHPDDPRAGYQR